MHRQGQLMTSLERVEVLVRRHARRCHEPSATAPSIFRKPHQENAAVANLRRSAVCERRSAAVLTMARSTSAGSGDPTAMTIQPPNSTVRCSTKNGMRNSFPAQYAGSRGWASSSRATLNPPTTTFSNQYSSTRGNTVQPSNRTPAIGRAFARRRTTRDGVRRDSEPEQVAQLEEEGVVRAREPSEPERVLVHHVAAVPGEHHRPRYRLIAEQHV